MCGILGSIFKSLPTVSETSWIERSIESLRHRGPDDSDYAYLMDGRVRLGHTRLAILDLSETGAQPMQRFGSLWLTFNGEIYNHHQLRVELQDEGFSFSGTSDSEVIIAAYRRWGRDFVKKLRGMYALCLVDTEKLIAFLCRDIVGEKPLYYRVEDNAIFFASEMHLLLDTKQFTNMLNLDALYEFLQLGYTVGNKTLCSNIKQVMPGEILEIELATLEINFSKYWKLPKFEYDLNMSLNDYTLVLDDLLLSSVRGQLIADVDVGVMLSGGLDSSLICSYAAQLTSRLRTFSAVYPDDESFNEQQHQRIIAQEFSNDHIEIPITHDIEDIFFDIIDKINEPFSDSSTFPTFLISRNIAASNKVVLGGDGGDELFGGYNQYQKFYQLYNTIGWLPLRLRKFTSSQLKKLIPFGRKGYNSICELAVDFNKDTLKISGMLDEELAISLLKDNPLISRVNFSPLEKLPDDAKCYLERSLRHDFCNYLPKDILTKVDRASMANSLEVRAPFLSQQIIEFVFSKIDIFYRSPQSDRKFLLKQIAEHRLPDDFSLNRKQGFNFPINRTLRRASIHKTIKEIIEQQDIFSPKYLKNLLESQYRGANHGDVILGITTFLLWARKYKVVY